MKNALIILFVAAITLAALCGCLLGYFSVRNPEADMAVNAPAEVPAAVNAPESPSSLDKLESSLRQELSGYSGDWAVCVKSLNNGAYLEIGNKKMVSASVIKLFIMAKVYEDIENGTLVDIGRAKELLTDMITISHNQASNDLVTMIGGGDFKEGMARVNAYAASRGYTETLQERDMRDYRPVPIPEQNYTSVRDCARLLEAIYKKQCVSPGADEEMLSLMLRQTRTWKIPAGLPTGIKCANKTGELGDVENDVAIVFSDNCDYILCVFSNKVPDTASAQRGVSKVSQMVYRYFSE